MNAYLRAVFFLLFFLRFTFMVNNQIFNSLFACLLVVLAVFLILGKGRLDRVTLTTIALILVVVMTGARPSLVGDSAMLTDFVRDALRYFTFIALYIIALDLGGRLERRKALDFLVLIIAAQVVIDLILLVAVPARIVHGDMRFSGLYEQIGIYGTFLGGGIAFLLGYQSENRGVKKLLLFGLIAALASLLAFNNTLKALVALGVAYAIHLVVDEKKLSKLVVLFLLSSLVILINPGVKERIERVLTATMDPKEIVGSKLDNSFQWRIGHWYLLMDDTLENRPLFGVGIGQERTVTAGFYSQDGSPFSTHSDVVRIFVESGLFGISVIMTLLSFLIFKLRKSWLGSPLMRPYLVMLYYLIINGVLGTVVFTTAFYFFVFLLGVTKLDISKRKMNPGETHKV